MAEILALMVIMLTRIATVSVIKVRVRYFYDSPPCQTPTNTSTMVIDEQQRQQAYYHEYAHECVKAFSIQRNTDNYRPAIHTVRSVEYSADLATSL